MSGLFSLGRGGRAIEAPSEEEVARAVREARAAGRRLRVAGSGGSKSGIGEAPDLLLRLRLPDRLLGVETGSGEGGGRATAPGDMTTGRLQMLLGREGLLLATVGEWKGATLAGSLATGTHGGSARHGITAGSLRGLRIVDGTGQVREVGPEDPDFEHLGVSLGAFGVVTAATLACAERFALELVTDVVPFEEYLRDPVAHESRAEFHASIWVPSARRVIRFAASRTEEPGRPVPRRERFGRRTALAHLLSRRLGLHGAVSSRWFRSRAVGDGAEILSPLEVPSGVARFRNVANRIRRRKAAELAVDAARASEALVRFERLVGAHPGALNNPIGLRMSAADGFSVSPCAGRDTLWLDLFYDEVEPFRRELAAAADELEARPHWGKALPLPAEAVPGRYPRWEAFAEARARFDPDETFANPFTDRLDLTGGGAGGPA